VKYGFILGLKKLFLKFISQTNTKNKKQANKQTKERKKSKPILY